MRKEMSDFNVMEILSSSSTTANYVAETAAILAVLDTSSVEQLVFYMKALTISHGRLFIVGIGGSAGTASHAVNDFRKICDIQAFCPTDNPSELTARINDEGWSTSYAEWLRGSRMQSGDILLVLSVGGGDELNAVSVPLVNAINYAKLQGSVVLGIVGRDGGFTAKKADACVVIPALYPDRVTPHTEGLTSVILHAIVSDPRLKQHGTKWETLVEELHNATVAANI
jgi:D-sedoheptulose 7-phosphate isomerase